MGNEIGTAEKTPLPRVEPSFFERKKLLCQHPIKSKEQYESWKRLHDEALLIIDAKMRELGWDVKPLALDDARQRFREESNGPIVIENPLPDRIATKRSWRIAYDLKWKSSMKNFGIINLRHFQGYKLYSDQTNTPTFLIFYCPHGKNVAHVEIHSPYKLLEELMWDGNPAIRFKNLMKGLPQ